MRIPFFVFVLSSLFFSGAAFPLKVQQVYQPHEVDTVAQPAGGYAMLREFIRINLQVPFRSGLKGLDSRAFVTAVVETDGTLSAIEALRGPDSLCNREVARVARLFRAWKPALLDGKPVRQKIAFPVPLKLAPRANFDDTRSAFIEYFNPKQKSSSDTQTPKYRTITPVDSNGLVSGDILYEEYGRKGWKEVLRVPSLRQELWYKADHLGEGIDSVQAYRITAFTVNKANHAPELVLQMNNRPLSYTEYEGSEPVSTTSYDVNGMVRVHRVFGDTLTTELRWYDNGQIQSVVYLRKTGVPFLSHISYASAWNRDGTPTLVEGNGHWSAPVTDPRGKRFVESGTVVLGARDGKWTAKWADGTLYYEETYERGVFKEGVHFDRDGTATTYTKEREMPVFKGGEMQMYRFLSQNIRYPSEAARAGISGKALISFVVCEDGTLCDYEVIRPLGFGIEDEALRVVKLMNGMWEPGVLKGRPVRIKFTLPINFQLENSPGNSAFRR